MVQGVRVRIKPYSDYDSQYLINWRSLMADEERELTECIRQILEKHGTLNGADLGGLLREKFPGVDLKPYGGLGKFVHSFCPKEVSVTNRGKVLFFSLAAGNLAKVTQRASKEPIELSVWTALTNPRLGQEIEANIDTGELNVRHNEEWRDNCVIVPPLGAEDYRVIIREFLEVVPVPVQREIQECLYQENFWSAFVNILSENRDGQLNDSWDQFRVKRILTYFRDRLSASDITEDAVTNAVAALERARVVDFSAKESNQQSKTQKVHSQGPSNPRRRQDGRNSIDPSRSPEIRSIIHHVIDKISDDDLRLVWIPLGAVIDYLTKRKD